MSEHGASTFGQDNGLIHEAVVTGRKVGAGKSFWSKLAHDEVFFREVVGTHLGTHEITLIEHIIDLSANPFCPAGWKLEEHRGEGTIHIERRGDDLYLDGKKIDFFLAEEQKMGLARGIDLRKILKDKPVLNANVLDYLLKHRDLIPQNWKRHSPFFWGTEYRDSDGILGVCCLLWNGVSWGYYCRGLVGGRSWDAFSPAVVLAA